MNLTEARAAVELATANALVALLKSELATREVRIAELTAAAAKPKKAPKKIAA